MKQEKQRAEENEDETSLLSRLGISMNSILWASPF